ncbi:MAG TPA: PEGA domain-containing protein [Polyangiaceae bacterium]|jgi:hypothetical protein
MGLGSKILAGCVAGALVLAQTPSAWAQKPPPPPSKADLAAAKRHYGEGDKKFKAGDYAGAEVEFKAADDIKAAPQTERYIGLCEDHLGHLQVAVDWFDRFLSHVPDRMAEQGEEIRKREAEIKAIPGKVRIESNPAGASVAVDDRPQSAPTPMDVDLPPGPHTIKLSAPGRLPTQKSIDVAFASRQTVSASLDLEPPPPPPPPPVAAVPPPPPPAPLPPPPEPRSQVPAYVTGGLAIVAAGVGTVFGIMALSDKSQFDKNPTTQTADNGDTHALIADMSFGVALTFGVTSAVLFLTRDEAPAASSAKPKTMTAKANHVTVTPTPVIGPHSGGAGFTVRF